VAIQDFLASVRLKDINNDTTSFTFYFQADDASTIAALTTNVQVLVSRLDAVTDAVIEELRITQIATLPSGLKGAAGPQPIASGELATYQLTSPPSKSFGVITPALNAAFNSNGIPQNTGANATYLGSWFTPFGTLNIVGESNLWGTLLKLTKLGLRTRKHRRQQDHNNTVG